MWGYFKWIYFAELLCSVDNLSWSVPQLEKKTLDINAVEVLTENTHHLLHMLDCFQLYFLLYFFQHFDYICALSLAIFFCCSICCSTLIIFVRPHGQEISSPPPSPSSSARWWRQRGALADVHIGFKLYWWDRDVDT